MTAAQDEARAIQVGEHEFDHPSMIRARRLWAGLLEREGVLAEGDMELVKFLQVDNIRDRLMADVVDPYAWDEPDYSDIFRGVHRPDHAMVERMRHATQACRNLSEPVPVEDHVPMLMISAMIQWLVGNGTLAAQGAAIALRINQDCQLARLMLTMASSGVQPAWMKVMTE